MTGPNMNDEIRWRSQLRQLNGPVQPARDLWPQIDPRLQTPRRRVRIASMAVAASLAIVCVASLLLLRARSHQSDRGSAPPAVIAIAHNVQTAPGSHTALVWALPKNPTLAAAAHDLDDASTQLQHALQQHPDAVFLVGLLNRTNAQRMRLLREPFTG